MVSEFYIKSEGWEQRKLKDICSDITIGLVKTMTKYYREKGVPLIRNSDIKENKIRKETLVYLDEVFAEENNDKRLKAGDIVTVHTGDIGTSAVIDQELHGAHGFATLNTRVKKDIIDEYYLCYYFNSPYFKNQAYSVSTGDGRNNLNLKDFINTTILFPTNLEEQRKIAAILSSVDEAIEKTEAIIEQTEKVKKGLMQQLLTKGIGHTKFKKTEIGEIPEEWEVKRVGEIANVIRGASPRPKGDPRYYGGTVPRLMVEDVTRDKKYVTPRVDFLTEEGAKLSRPMKKGDLVVVCSGTVGVPAILAVDACIHDGFLGFKDIDKNCDKEYLFYTFSLLRSKLDASATHGGVFTNLTTQIMREFSFPLPPIDEQKKIVEILTSVDEKIDKEKDTLNSLQSIKKALMQVLLTGKVRVKVDDEVMSQ